jgi:D-hexose-6-phosphate mutarotase
MSDTAALDDEYGIPGRVVFKEGAGGLSFVELANNQGSAVIALQGGQLISWIPREGQEVLWLSREAKFIPGKAIRGGVPICWPWFGAHPGFSSFPAHGFARTLPWQVVAARTTSDEDTLLILQLQQKAAAGQYWPYSSELVSHITLGEALKIRLITRNTGVTPITVSEALHTYFHVSDVRNIAVSGLGDCEYLDKVDGYKRKRQTGPVMIGGEIDRIYLDAVTDCLIDDPGLNRRIRIIKRGSRSTVVWNPWSEKAAKMGDLGGDGYLKMVCVESANAADNQLSIAPGDEHHLDVIYRLERLPSQHP